ncbi:hypothetical protein GOBAR_AA20093 [Gossypium barbadense]|uniref:Uncharacterized protein n=1 Tax=Gossypium barbadense TaxID=3634 RepID=A0A2P5XB75_GOSBA|nr:hypothetical protein GOBAR_AA20093 [Gossypium barbadense]
MQLSKEEDKNLTSCKITHQNPISLAKCKAWRQAKASTAKESEMALLNRVQAPRTNPSISRTTTPVAETWEAALKGNKAELEASTHPTMGFA